MRVLLGAVYRFAEREAPHRLRLRLRAAALACMASAAQTPCSAWCSTSRRP